MKRHKIESTLIEVDWDNFEDVRQLFREVKARYLELDPSRITRKERERIILDSCFRIWETDISDIFIGLELDEKPEYYVYAHCNPTRPWMANRGKAAFGASLGLQCAPFYIGKGTGRRAYDLNRSETHRKIKQKIQSKDKEPEIYIIKGNLTELEALSMESKLIDIYGLVAHRGYLTNLDEGFNKDDRRYKYIEDYKILCPAEISDWS